MTTGAKAQAIDAIRCRMEAEGFAPKDFFLTQPPPPTRPHRLKKPDPLHGWSDAAIEADKVAWEAYCAADTAFALWEADYETWKAREHRRRAIALQMKQCGLTAHDFAPPRGGAP